MINLKNFTLLLITAASLFSFCGCGKKENEDESLPETSSEIQEIKKDEKAEKTESKSSDEPAEAEEEMPHTGGVVHISCVGDTLIHSSIYEQAMSNGNLYKKYNFDETFKNVRDMFKSADLSIVCQDTIITDTLEPSGYPNFCTPSQMGDSLIDMGFDVIAMNSPHMLDYENSGAYEALKFWEKKYPEVMTFGLYKKQSDSYSINIYSVGGINIAFLGFSQPQYDYYTDNSNGAYLVETDSEEALQAIKAAKKEADVVIVSAGFSQENYGYVSDYQRNLCQDMINSGADLILGRSQREVKTCEYLTRQDGSKGFVFYSLGNFVSGMDSAGAMGLCAELDIGYDIRSHKVTIGNIKVTPLITEDGVVYPYNDYSGDKSYIDQILSNNIPVEYWKKENPEDNENSENNENTENIENSESTGE